LVPCSTCCVSRQGRAGSLLPRGAIGIATGSRNRMPSPDPAARRQRVAACHDHQCTPRSRMIRARVARCGRRCRSRLARSVSPPTPAPRRRGGTDRRRSAADGSQRALRERLEHELAQQTRVGRDDRVVTGPPTGKHSVPVERLADDRTLRDRVPIRFSRSTRCSVRVCAVEICVVVPMSNSLVEQTTGD